jgi:hypothetical protein
LFLLWSDFYAEFCTVAPKRLIVSIPLPLVQGFYDSSPVLLVAAAFPALERLVISDMQLTYMDLEHLSTCTHLISLMLTSCQLLPTRASRQDTSPLASVASLRELQASGLGSTIARGLTQLTSLQLRLRDETIADCLRNLRGIQNLQQLHVVARNPPRTPVLHELLGTTVQLRDLRLSCSLHQQDVDLLLKHAPQLTHLACILLHVTEDRSQSACSWAELVIENTDISVLAYLPLGCIRRLRCGYLELPSSCPVLEFALYEDEDKHRRKLSSVMQAVASLGSCPAWQQSGSALKCSVSKGEIEVNAQGSLAATVTALSVFANRQVEVSINYKEACFTDSVVEQLGRALGFSLRQLHIYGGHISKSFWPAVWAHLPGLEQLTLGPHAGGAVDLDDLASFCSRAARPLQLGLSGGLYSLLEPVDRLEEQCRVWGVPQVTVTCLPDKDAFFSTAWP